MISSIIFGLILVAAGVAILRYFPQITSSVGRFDAVERYMGGGSYIIWLAAGFILILLGLLLIFGLLDNVAAWFFSPFTPDL